MRLYVCEVFRSPFRVAGIASSCLHPCLSCSHSKIRRSAADASRTTPKKRAFYIAQKQTSLTVWRFAPKVQTQSKQQHGHLACAYGCAMYELRVAVSGRGQSQRTKRMITSQGQFLRSLLPSNRPAACHIGRGQDTHQRRHGRTAVHLISI